MLSFEETIRAVGAIEKTIDEAGYGWANQGAIKAVQAQVFLIKTGRSDAYISEKIGIISECAGVLYSPRKADKWGGSMQVKRAILAACQSLRDQARILEQSTDVSDSV